MAEADLIPDILLEILAPIAPASEEQAALNPGIAGLASAVDAVVHEPNGVRDATLQAVARARGALLHTRLASNCPSPHREQGAL